MSEYDPQELVLTVNKKTIKRLEALYSKYNEEAGHNDTFEEYASSLVSTAIWREYSELELDDITEDAYKLVWQGEPMDGHFITGADTKEEAIQIARKLWGEHKYDFDSPWGGLVILDKYGKEVEW